MSTLGRDEILAKVREECALQRYILAQADRYRVEPGDTVLSDVANAEVDGQRLTDSELVSMMEQVFVAGHETTTGTMAHGRRVRANGCDFYSFRAGLVVKKDSYWKIVE